MSIQANHLNAYHFLGYPDLVGELGLDDKFPAVPATKEEAEMTTALLVQTPEMEQEPDIFRRLKMAKDSYRGPSRRHILTFVPTTEFGHVPTFFDEAFIPAPVIHGGVFEYFMQKVNRYFESHGLTRDVVETILHAPVEEREASTTELRFYLGLERDTARVALMRTSEDVHLFLEHSPHFKAKPLPIKGSFLCSDGADYFNGGF